VSEGKQNYEREKARKEMRGKIAKAREFSQEAESIHTMLYLGACMMGSTFEADSAVRQAVKLFEKTKEQAAILATVKHPFDQLSVKVESEK